MSAVTSTLRLVRERAVYLWIAFLAPSVSILGHAVAPGREFFKGQDLGVISGLALTAAAVVMWVPYHRERRPQPLVVAFVVVVVLAWATQLVRIQSDNSLFNVTAVCLPVILVMIVIKPPGARDIEVAGLALMYGLALAAIVSIPLGAMGWMPNGFDATDSAGCRTPIICDLTGGLDRWAGPFGSVNYAAPIGGLLIVMGAAQHRPHNWILVACGGGVLILSQGRSALFALIAGIAVLVLWGARVSALPRAKTIRIVALLALAVGAVLYVRFIDPTINGRTGIWADFLALWRSAPLVGVGDSGVDAYVAGRANLPELITVSHAHSVLIDMLVRWGLPLAVLTVSVYGIAAAAAGRGLKLVGPGPLAVVTFVIVAGIVETIYSWEYWTVYLAALAWAVLKASQNAAIAEGVAERRLFTAPRHP